MDLENLTNEELNLEAKRQLAREKLLYFTQYTFDGYDTNWHHEYICKELDKFAEGHTKRLALFIPPRHGKSELASIRFPAFIFGKDPDSKIIACTYSADYAHSWNRKVQRVIDSDIYRELFPWTRLNDRHARTTSDERYIRTTNEFEIVGNTGYYKSVGVGGGITGRGFTYGIIDDPVKGRDEADSPTIRNKIWEWYINDFKTRQEGDAGILLIMTRWHEDDLAGRIMRMTEEDDGEPWRVIRFPAIKDQEDKKDPRKMGKALWPTRFPLKKLAEYQKDPRSWSALYQQRPVPLGGDIFKEPYLRYYDLDGEVIRRDNRFIAIGDLRRFIIVDLAATTKTYSDYTTIGAWGGDSPGNLYGLDMNRKRMEGPEILPAVRAMQEKWNIDTVWMESTAFQIALIQQGRKEGMNIRELKALKDKISRAIAATSIMEAGKFWLPRFASWLGVYLPEVLNFPSDKFDDQVDNTVYAVQVWNEHYLGGGFSDPGYLQKAIKSKEEETNPEWVDEFFKRKNESPRNPYSDLTHKNIY